MPSMCTRSIASISVRKERVLPDPWKAELRKSMHRWSRLLLREHRRARPGPGVRFPVQAGVLH